MDSFIEEFMNMYGPEVSRQLASNLGVKQDVVSQMIPLITPLILGGLKRQMKEYGGEARVNHILSKYGNPSSLDNLGEEVSSRAQYQQPDPRLGGLLGESGVQAALAMGQKFNVNPKTVMMIISILAPIILGALVRKRDREKVGPQGIANLIDRDGNESILDDVIGMLLGGLGGPGSQGAAGLIGDLIKTFTTPRCGKCGSSLDPNFRFCPYCGLKI
ncbi:MAG: DUF937 domain-containing protein [Candidatus Bathyarchaeia archaeon]|nr:DUF937 domain-containing protein [Candidatus Bathyarchaeota archaeon]